ncbi:putative ribonuclease H-like domain-containing protein, partial [Tanacetum coccineum]
MSFDDLLQHFKIVEQEVKRTASTSTSLEFLKDMDFDVIPLALLMKIILLIGKANEDEPQPFSDAGKKEDEVVSKESGNNDQERYENSTQDVNTVGPSINTEPDMFSLGDNTTLEATYADFFGDETEMDVKSALLYGRIKEEVYVYQPLGFEDPDYPDKVYKVVKALYGLHQALRAWYETLAKYLLDNGFHRGKIDQTLFIKKQKWDILLLHVYVDDIIFGSTKKELCTEFEKLMHDKFQMSFMGELTFFLGLLVKQKEDGIFISQDKYVADILRKFSFTDVRTTSTPIDTEKPLVKDSDGDDVEVYLYSDYARASLDRKYTTG